MDQFRYAILLLTLMGLFLSSCISTKQDYEPLTREILQDSILQIAQRNLLQVPITVTASHSDRSSGGLHDFF